MDLKMLLMIFFINFIYVTLSTIRLLLTMKGYRLIAPVVSMFEIIIYVLGLSLVLDSLDNPVNLIVYALGFAIGIGFGIRIEDRMALGYTMVTAILPSTSKEEDTLPATLRAEGYGVTVSYGEGLEGPRLMLEILSPRNKEKQLYQTIHSVESRAFIISYEPKHISGGFWTKKVRKRMGK
ncbi:DUF2179 domain-containing protein [Enterococcus olivae]